MMPSTSQKHNNFVAGPMGKKPSTDLPGIEDELGKRLEAAGFGKASTILGQYLLFKKDAEMFKKWLTNTCNANPNQAAECYQCLKDWCTEFM